MTLGTSYLDQFLFGVRTIFANGVELVQQRTRMNIIGATVADNPATKCTDVTIGGGPPSGDASGDLGGSYPSPRVQQISGDTDDPASDLDVEARRFHHIPDGSPNASVYSETVSVTSANNTLVEAYRFAARLNAAQFWNVVVTATHVGDGDGIGNVIDAWSAKALVHIEPDNSPTPEIISSSVSAAEGTSGWHGPSWSGDSPDVVLSVQGLGGAGTIHWTVQVQITEAL